MSTCNNDQHDEGRRDFFRKGLRWTIALTLGGGLVALTLGRGWGCVNDGVCTSCAILAGCDLPDAVAARQKK